MHKETIGGRIGHVGIVHDTVDLTVFEGQDFDIAVNIASTLYARDEQGNVRRRGGVEDVDDPLCVARHLGCLVHCT